MKRLRRPLALPAALLVAGAASCIGTTRSPAAPVAAEFPFFSYLRGTTPHASLIAFSPTNHDPRPGADHRVPSADSLRADLEALHPAFDGLVLYGYEKAVTPILLAEARRQGYRAALLGIWNLHASEEIAGTAELVGEFHRTMALAVCIGNEGIAFHRYTAPERDAAAEQLRRLLPPGVHVPICTSEPFGEYGQIALREFGDFLAPNIHPVFDRPELGPADAAAWAREQARALAEATGRPVLVKETGFPHGGDARFTPTTQQQFWAAYLAGGRLATVSSTWVSYAAAFEAFELPWKAAQTGMPIEEFWGFLRKTREPFPVFTLWQGLKGQ